MKSPRNWIRNNFSILTDKQSAFLTKERKKTKVTKGIRMIKRPLSRKALKDLLEEAADRYNRKSFIEDDPISVPHQYSKKQDIEIAGFFAATFAWGLRKTIINKSNELMQLMDDAPHDFIVNHREKDRKKFLHFKHRTFQSIDLLYFLEFLQQWYQQNESLETAFVSGMEKKDPHVENAIIRFEKQFRSLDTFPRRTQKHVASPERNSTCKRLNMFLRWMVRRDRRKVDFGIWKKIKPAQLLIPFDVHVERVARQFGLIKRKQKDWQTVLELTDALKRFDPKDPVRYDFALFGIGVLDSPIRKK